MRNSSFSFGFFLSEARYRVHNYYVEDEEKCRVLDLLFFMIAALNLWDQDSGDTSNGGNAWFSGGGVLHAEGAAFKRLSGEPL